MLLFYNTYEAPYERKDSMTDIKMVIIVRKDLHCRAGKIAAQVAHASMKVILDMMMVIEPYPLVEHWTLKLRKDSALYDWLSGHFTKIVLYVDSLEEMESIEKSAKELGIPTAKIIDAGKTEFHNVPTPTCVALGPYDGEVLNRLTGHLKLI